MKSGLNTLSAWSGLFMILLLVTGATAIIFTDFMDERLYGNKRLFFVILLLAYSVYRGFRLYRSLQEAKNEN